MSDESLRQQHPDADLLAGFAESRLTQHERESVLSHLAVCARCRQLVFLAHQVEPTPDPQISYQKPRSLWRRHWFPLLASASAVVVLATISFSWFGQLHKQTAPKSGEVAQQRSAPKPADNENASKTVEVPSPPPVAAVTKDKQSAAKRVGAAGKVERVIAPPSPQAALDSGGASGEEVRSFTEPAQPTAVQRNQMELGSNYAAKKAQSTGAMQSAAGSNAGKEDKAGYSTRAVQPGKINSRAMDAWDAPPSGGAAVTSAQVYRQASPPPPAESNPAPQSKQVHAEGCVEQGVEAGCLMVKDRHSGQLYHILIKGSLPQPGEGIQLIGVPHDGPTSCMQGIPLNVITWVNKSSLNCAQSEAPKK